MHLEGVAQASDQSGPPHLQTKIQEAGTWLNQVGRRVCSLLRFTHSTLRSHKSAVEKNFGSEVSQSRRRDNRIGAWF